jgi:methyl-accepting chemotaxis protein
VTSLQFQDMSTQVIGTVSRRLTAMDQLMHSVSRQSQQLPTTENADLAEQGRVLEMVLKSSAQLVRENHHNPVSQKNMDEGDIELF